MSIAIVTVAELPNMSLAALVETYNDIPGVKPVKKFASKADAIKRIEAAIATQNEAVEESKPEGWSEIEAGTETVAIDGVSGSNHSEKAPPVLTSLQFLVMDRIAHAEHNITNGATPTQVTDVNTWLWGDQLSSETGLTVNQVGGVLASLINAGCITVVDIGTKEAAVAFTDEGFAAWQILNSIHGSPDAVEPAEGFPEDASFFPEFNPENSPAHSGFQYKTREELAKLAEENPEERAAYRMARRKAARMARKAKKAKAE